MKLTPGAFILARYSTDNQEQDSIEVQVEKCAAWCQDNSIPVLDIFADYAVSGMKDTRPQYSRMMNLLQKGHADTVVIYDQSRMFRKMTAWFQFRDELENLGVRVVSVTQPMIGGDLKDPSNFLMEGSMALFNQMWVLQTRQKVVEKMRYMARNGIHTGGLPPLGYQVKDQRLVIDPQEAEAVRRIFTMYDSGMSYHKILDALNSDGIFTKRGNPFGKNSIHDILKNKKYIGTMVYGKTAQRPNGTRNSHRTSADVIEIEDGCPAIIDKELFQRVQKKLESKKHTGGRPPISEEFCLRGKVFCGDCKSPMNIHYSGGGRKYIYYACSAQKRTYICQSKPVRVRWLESTIAQALRSNLGTPQDRSQLLTILRQQRNALYQGVGGKMATLCARRKEVVLQLDNAAKAILQGLSSSTVLSKIKALENEKESLDYQIDQLHADISKTSLSESEIGAALEQIISGVDSDDASILSIVYRVEVFSDRLNVWTLLDCSPGGEQHEKISIPTTALADPPAEGFCAELVGIPRLFQYQ